MSFDMPDNTDACDSVPSACWHRRRGARGPARLKRAGWRTRPRG